MAPIGAEHCSRQLDRVQTSLAGIAQVRNGATNEPQWIVSTSGSPRMRKGTIRATAAVDFWYEANC